MRALRLIAIAALLAPGVALAGAQAEEPLSASVQASLQKAVSDRAVTALALASDTDARRWLGTMSPRLERQMANESLRLDFLRTVHYEATRAGLEPELVLGLIQVESAFRKYALSTAGARGFMQVMPFWVTAIGNTEHNLFHLRTNLRYGCTILRHYLDIERGNLFRALGRYNGSLGQPEYPNLVLRAWRAWQVPSTQTVEFRPPARLPSRTP
jgi:soluble lytic murein transglycosylase-like protein